MDIIKFKDTITDNECFNELLKGKYAYWINMKWAIPFDLITEADYIRMSRSHEWTKNVLNWRKGFNYWDTDEPRVRILIDDAKTEEANSLECYKLCNSIALDANISLEEIKKFRTWVAERIIQYNRLSDDDLYLMKYYARGMYDDTVRVLSKVDRNSTLSVTGANGCSTCSNGSNLYDFKLNICDALQTYRSYMYASMVEMFSNIDFWKGQYNEFLQLMKSYVDGILKANLPLSPETTEDLFKECNCNLTSASEFAREILGRLSQALKYIIDNDMTGHKLFIAKAFGDWATLLYEQMEWK